MSEPVVHVSELTKIFKVPEREAGLRAAAKALFRRQTRAVCAVVLEGHSAPIALEDLAATTRATFRIRDSLRTAQSLDV